MELAIIGILVLALIAACQRSAREQEPLQRMPQTSHKRVIHVGPGSGEKDSGKGMSERSMQNSMTARDRYAMKLDAARALYDEKVRQNRGEDVDLQAALDQYEEDIDKIENDEPYDYHYTEGDDRNYTAGGWTRQ